MTEFAVGAEVCVKCSATFYHIPGHKEGRDAIGMVGKVVRVYTEAADGCYTGLVDTVKLARRSGIPPKACTT